MTRIAIISDIHSNWEALKAVWERIEELGCDDVFCLGDTVGYGARPVECLEHLLTHEVTCIQGNHDEMVADPTLPLKGNQAAIDAVLYNRSLLTDKHLQFLKSLPTQREIARGVLLVHGSAGNRDRYLVYRHDLKQSSLELLVKMGPGICFQGHTHQPIVFSRGDFIPKPLGAVQVNEKEMMLINPGSVGQPRDGDPRASFLYWDKEDNTINFQRVNYDVAKTRAEILVAGLPPRLAERLAEGR